MASGESTQLLQSNQTPHRDAAAEPVSEHSVTTDVAYSVFTTWQKKSIALAASIAAVFSPISTTIYLPAINQIASDLHVTSSQINLTVTTFLVGSFGF